MKVRFWNNKSQQELEMESEWFEITYDLLRSADSNGNEIAFFDGDNWHLQSEYIEDHDNSVFTDIVFYNE